MELVQPVANDLGHFFDYLYGGEAGAVYLATKTFPGLEWSKHWFDWPTQRTPIVDFVIANRNNAEVYMAPALFTLPGKADKANVLGSSVVWVEFDGHIPTDLQGVAEPTLRVRSSGELNEHWYWKLDRVVAPDELERINRALTYKFGADSSGWDCTQVLRPPESFNHKRKKETKLLFMADESIRLQPALFDSLPEPPPAPVVPVPAEIPQVEHVVMKYSFTESVRKLFVEGAHDRSDGLMALGYSCAEMGMVHSEIIAVLLNADERWGKFKGRSDRMQRLMEIVTIAKNKYPVSVLHQITTLDIPQVTLTHCTIEDILTYDLKFEWQWDSYLQKNGFMLLTGSPGVGKTQFALNAAMNMVIGKPFLGSEMRPSRVCFLSLEMGKVDLGIFLSQQVKSFTPEEREKLHDDFLILPVGEQVMLSRDDNLKLLADKISAENLDGVIIDSLGASTNESLNDESMREVLNRIKSVFSKLNCFLWFIHHNRKANGENKKPNKLSDVYGSQYITSVPDTVVGLAQGAVKDVIDVFPLKVRLAACPPTFSIRRDGNLNFSRLVSQDPIQILPETASFDPEGPTEPNEAQGPPTPQESGLTGNGQVKGKQEDLNFG